MKTQTIAFNNFMTGEYKQSKKKVRREFKIDKKQIMAAGTALIPFAAVAHMPVFANTNVSAVPVTTVPVEAVPTVGMDQVGKELISMAATLFDPLVDILVAISFPVASVMILWKVFCGFWKDSGEVWEGIGKVSIFYILIQMSPIFMNILKQLGTLAVGI